MITDAFIGIVYLFIFALTALFRVTPVVSLPGTWTDSVEIAGHYIISLDHFVPVAVIIGALFIFTVYEIAYFGMKLINWVIRKIPGIA